MIWFLLGIAPLVLLLVVLAVDDPVAFLITIGVTALIIGGVFVALFGAWEMGWVTNCGTFWESMSCS